MHSFWATVVDFHDFSNGTLCKMEIPICKVSNICHAFFFSVKLFQMIHSSIAHFLLQNTDTVIVSPTFEFECTDKGIYEHDSDCARFWLCKAQNGEPELYKCPAGYLFNDEKRRCVKEDEVTCDKVPDFSRIAYEPQPIQLQVSQLDSFFSRWANY